MIELTDASRLLWMVIEWKQRGRLQDVPDSYEAAGDLTLVYFRPVVTGNPERVGFDGIHFTEEGYAVHASTKVEAIGAP